ncbi:MAG: hypothetical protein Q4D99_06785 [Bacillota bacterium]|nr:hypothetical protein [Bacillota bacterium]
MRTRYGNDELNKFLFIVCLVVIGVNLFLQARALHVLVILILIVTFSRSFSRCFDKRAQENMKFLELKNRFFGSREQKVYHKAAKADRKAANEGKRVLICPYCKEKLRVPVGAGKIKIKCPHCNSEFEETV